MSDAIDIIGILAFLGVVISLCVLLVAGCRIRVQTGPKQRAAQRIAFVVAAIAVTFLANLALFRHDTHFDLTRERAFTPSKELRTVVDGLTEPVSIVYFYQSQSPAARSLNTILEQLPKRNSLLHVRVIDADQNPAIASANGVRIYNAAILSAGDRRLQVVTTDDNEIGLGLMRLLRKQSQVVCHVTGHNEYDIDNFEFHTHFEGRHSHSHNAQGVAVVQMTKHGMGRVRRALQKLGFEERKIGLTTSSAIPSDCKALVVANPRNAFTPPEVSKIADYLSHGGSAMFLLEPSYALEPSLAALLVSAGVRVGNGYIVDPKEHYFTDEQMIAVTKYPKHPITRGLALSFYPGARPLTVVATPGTRAKPIITSSVESYILTDRLSKETAKPSSTGAHAIGIASEGTLGGNAKKSFRLLVFGDADFASNSFFPYLANADVFIASTSWLLREKRAPGMRPPVEVLPMVTMTNSQMHGVFILSVFILPGLMALAGGLVWWFRR